MDREQAAEIHRHLLSAAKAINRARNLTLDLSEEDRAAFAEPLGDVAQTLQYELLQKMIYRQFSDLRPPSKEIPRINSKLTWDQVNLPPTITVMDFDRVILSLLSQYRRKTAATIGRVSEHYRSLGIDLDPAIAAARLMVMVDSGLVEVAGDLRMWRFSEVWLRP
jgi:hypothetical protein